MSNDSSRGARHVAREVSAGYGELALVELPAIDLLASLGWSHKNLYAESFGALGSEGRESETQVVLTRRLRAALEALNPGLPADAYEQAVEQLAQDRSRQIAVNANREVYRLLKDGVKVKVPDEHGGHSTETLRVIDWAVPDNNEFFLASQMWVAGDMYRRRCDLLGFVNGLPLVFIELKQPAVPLKTAFDDNLRDYRGQSVPQLFHPNAFIVLSNGSDTKIGTLTSAWEHFFDWKRVADEAEAGKVSLERALRGLLEPAKLLDYVENFTVFEEGKGGLAKKVAKNHQLLGVNKAIARLVELREAERHDRKNPQRKRLGVFWHTQGSGKSLSMVFFTQKVLRRVIGSCTFVIVTDRDELDDQIGKTFKATGAVAREDVRATSGEHLKELLRGNERYIFTLIQKFRNEPGQPYPELSSRSDVIVITDEAHRSQYDVFALNMRNALPNAGFIGFTGTPLIKGEEERTREVFGDYVSVYDFARSIDDGATVPLYYENRIPEVQLTNRELNRDLEALLEAAELDEDQEKKLAREFGREYHVITRDDRLEAIARDIVAHFTGRGYRGKAMMVCIDKATAVRMHDKVRAHWQAEIARLKAALAPAGGVTDGDAREALIARLHLMETTDMAVVVSQGQNEVEDLEGQGPRHRPAPAADAEGSAGREVQGREGRAAAGLRLRDVDHRLRRADLLDDLPRQADAGAHADADHRARQPRGAGQGERADRRLRRHLPRPAGRAGHLRTAAGRQGRRRRRRRRQPDPGQGGTGGGAEGGAERGGRLRRGARGYAGDDRLGAGLCPHRADRRCDRGVSRHRGRQEGLPAAWPGGWRGCSRPSCPIRRPASWRRWRCWFRISPPGCAPRPTRPTSRR